MFHIFDEILESLGIVTKVDRVYYFEAEVEKRLISQKFEWTNQNIEPQIDNPDLQNVPFEFFLDIVVPLKSKKIYKKITTIINEYNFLIYETI